MEKNTSLRDKLQQHEFEYRAGAWEEMETLLNAATPMTQHNRNLSFHKWMKYLGVAAVMGAIVFFYNGRQEDKASSYEVSGDKTIATPASNNIVVPDVKVEISKIDTKEAAQLSTNKGVGERKSIYNNGLSSTLSKESPSASTKIQQRTEHNSISEPVDDSKVYRENKNHKHAHQITDENSKAPAASDLHH